MGLTFDVIDATLAEEYGGTVDIWDRIKPVPEDPISKPERKSYLSFRVKLTEGEQVTLSGGQRLDRLAGYVALYPHIGDFEENAKGIGVMSYYDDAEDSVPARYYIKALLPRAQFDDLLTAVRLGRVPSNITVDARGMTLPDEFSQMWDEKASPHLHIASINFSVPLVEHKNPDNDQSQLRALAELMHSMNTKLKWLAVLVAICAAALLVRAL